MSVKYKLLKNSKELSKLSEYRAVTIENQVVDIEQIGEDIQNATTLTPSDINAAIIAIRREMAIQLKMDDVESEKLSSEIAEKIQNEMTYPGQVKITVIRETRSVAYAK